MCPAHHNPGQPSNTTITWCATLGFAVVAAVRRGPENTDRLTTSGAYRIDLEHVRDIVGGQWVVGAVHGQGDRVVVYSDIWLPICPGNPGAGATTTGEQVHHQLFLKWQAHAWLAVDELGFLLLCGHRGSLGGIVFGFAEVSYEGFFGNSWFFDICICNWVGVVFTCSRKVLWCGVHRICCCVRCDWNGCWLRP
ncbi:hypothetical protein EMIT0P74_10208 [Pseudomonas sp. IT-P74]